MPTTAASPIERSLPTYTTPPHGVTAELLPHLPGVRAVWEPAAGSGKMVEALRGGGLSPLAGAMLHPSCTAA